MDTSNIPVGRKGGAVKRLAIGAVVCLLVGIGVFAFSIWRRIGDAILDAYAQKSVADMVIQFMEWNGGSWPQGWDELEEPY